MECNRCEQRSKGYYTKLLTDDRRRKRLAFKYYMAKDFQKFCSLLRNHFVSCLPAFQLNLIQYFCNIITISNTFKVLLLLNWDPYKLWLSVIMSERNLNL